MSNFATDKSYKKYPIDINIPLYSFLIARGS